MPAAEATVQANDATVSTGPPSDDDKVLTYLATRVEEIEAGIEKAKTVAAGALQTAKTLADDLKQARADLKAHRATREG